MKVLSFILALGLFASCNNCSDIDIYSPSLFIYTPVTSNYEQFYSGTPPLYKIDSLEITDAKGNSVYFEHWHNDGKIRIELNKNRTEIFVKYSDQLKDTFQFGYWLNNDECYGETISQINVYRKKNLLCEKCINKSHTLIVE